MPFPVKLSRACKHGKQILYDDDEEQEVEWSGKGNERKGDKGERQEEKEEVEGKEDGKRRRGAKRRNGLGREMRGRAMKGKGQEEEKEVVEGKEDGKRMRTRRARWKGQEKGKEEEGVLFLIQLCRNTYFMICTVSLPNSFICYSSSK